MYSREDQWVCHKWTRAADGCTRTCESKRAHVCEWCRQPHRTVSCPTLGQVAGSGTSGGKGNHRKGDKGGKGRGKGGESRHF